jgi:hypothetical protein
MKYLDLKKLRENLRKFEGEKWAKRSTLTEFPLISYNLQGGLRKSGRVCCLLLIFFLLIEGNLFFIFLYFP